MTMKDSLPKVTWERVSKIDECTANKIEGLYGKWPYIYFCKPKITNKAFIGIDGLGVLIGRDKKGRLPVKLSLHSLHNARTLLVQCMELYGYANSLYEFVEKIDYKNRKEDIVGVWYSYRYDTMEIQKDIWYDGSKKWVVIG